MYKSLKFKASNIDIVKKMKYDEVKETNLLIPTMI